MDVDRGEDLHDALVDLQAGEVLENRRAEFEVLRRRLPAALLLGLALTAALLLELVLAEGCRALLVRV